MRTRAGYFFMDKQTFDQPSLSISNQLNLLKQRNLIINDAELAEHFLKTIGYYRLKAYFQPFLLNNNSDEGFKTGSTFSNILNLYIFDRYSRYHLPEHPPSWMMMECLSFGTVSKAYSNLKDRSIRKEVGDILGQFSEILKSWMKALTYTRNVCAHHGRLWNRFFINKPKNAKVNYIPPNNASPFSMQAYIIIKLLDVIAPGNHWKDRLFILFEEHETLVPLTEMGFSEIWKNDAIWEL